MDRSDLLLLGGLGLVGFGGYMYLKGRPGGLASVGLPGGTPAAGVVSGPVVDSGAIAAPQTYAAQPAQTANALTGAISQVERATATAGIQGGRAALQAAASVARQYGAAGDVLRNLLAADAALAANAATAYRQALAAAAAGAGRIAGNAGAAFASQVSAASMLATAQARAQAAAQAAAFRLGGQLVRTLTPAPAPAPPVRRPTPPAIYPSARTRMGGPLQ